MIFWLLSLTSFTIWVYLIFFRGYFWLNRVSENACFLKKEISFWPPIVAIIPARNEEKTLPLSLPSLFEQDYQGSLSIIIVDDESEDRTFSVAQNISRNFKRHLTIVRGKTLPTTNWTGKVWALYQGVAECEKLQLPCQYYFFTDADIVYGKQSLANLVYTAQINKSLLTSFMVKLHCRSFAEKLLIPAFVFFFNMIFPFPWVNRKDSKTAAAAGGCLLVDRNALRKAGGLLSIQSALIDDCTLAKNLKRHGPIWLGFAKTAESIRQYTNLNDIRVMVSRTAFEQLNNSYILLLGTICGMVLTFLLPPILTFTAPYPSNLLGSFSFIAMTISFIPTLRDYKCSPIWSLTLPLIATSYIVFTIDSALQNFQGQGGYWKGRVQAIKTNDEGSKRP